MPVTEFIVLLILGFCAGTFGGLLGIGGSVLMIPVLTLLLQKNYHLAQAAAMIVNFFVAAPSVLRHHRAGAVRWTLALRMLPFGVVCILIGVFLSNTLEATWLIRLFGAFLLFEVINNTRRLIRRKPEPLQSQARTGWPIAGVLGSLMGSVAGLLGIGGGALVVPLLNRFGQLPLRQAIATSSAVMCITSIVGAVTKNVSLSSLQTASGDMLSVRESLLIAGCLAPTAIIGGMVGATLTHIVPLPYVRLVFVLLLTYTSLQMLGVF